MRRRMSKHRPETGAASTLSTSARSPAVDAVDALRVALAERMVAAVLFGSQARGEAHKGSDWDILLIATDLPSKMFDRHLYLKRLLPPNCRAVVSMIARTPAEFEASLPSLLLDVALDGQILYDPHEYAASRLAIIRRIIARKGLYRERTANGDIWRWRTKPTQPWRLDWGD